jgi:hypothetical protein
MAYEQHIIKVFVDVGEQGISAALLAKHVYNMSITLFEQPDYEDIKKRVRQFIIRNSRTPRSLLERTGRWGFYRLNTHNSVEAYQTQLQFQPHQDL